MKQTEKKVIAIAAKVIKKFYLDYNSNEEFTAGFRANQDLLFDLGKKDIWTISFEYGKEDFGTDVSGFLTILDENLKPVYFNSRNGAGKLSDDDLDEIWPDN